MLHIEQIRPELTWKLRQEALYPETPVYKMRMEEDDEGYHFGAFTDNRLVGVISLFPNGLDYQFRKFAVEPSIQKQGVGTALLAYIETFARAEGAQRLWCNARVNSTGFYLKAGFKPTAQTFTKNSIDYEIMDKLLN